MVRHIIFFKFREDAPAEQVEAAVQALRSLKQEVPQIREFTIGKAQNKGPRPPRYNWAMVMDFDSFEDLDAYNKSAAHDRVVQEHLVPLVEHITGIDYDLEPYRA
ncbi:MAG: stress responsive protein [Dehalococcoidia bacterium]|nr:MAG: stress responsive protein [Dehalococcoidia bacterium]